MRYTLSILIVSCAVAASLRARADAEEAHEDARPKILIVTNDAEDQSHMFIEKALAPSKRGARFDVKVVQPEFLAKESLDGFATIFLDDVAKLSGEQLKALQKRVDAGAGLCFFVGPNADVAFYNKTLYAGGKGLFPLPLGKPANMPEGKTSIVAEKHPVLNVFAGDAKALLDIVLVTRCHTPAADWKPENDKALSVIARSASGNPIALSRPRGKGNVVVFLFVPDRRWANWHFYPAWVIMLQELQTFMTEY